MKRTVRNLLILSVVTIINIVLYVYASGSNTFFWKTGISSQKQQELNIRQHYVSMGKMNEKQNHTSKELPVKVNGINVDPGPVIQLSPNADKEEIKKQLEIAKNTNLAKEDQKEEILPVVVDQQVNHVDQPVNNIDQPVNHVDQPVNHVDQPVNHVDQPVNHVDQPVNHIDQPVNHVDQPVNNIDQPVNHIDQPGNNVQQNVVDGNPVKPNTGIVNGVFQVDPELLAVSQGHHIFPHNFKLVMNHPEACHNGDGSPKDIFLAVLICTIHKNFEQRKAIRETWASYGEVNGKKIVTIFLLAKTEDKNLQALVNEEDKKYKDLIMEDFQDTYKNLTLKTMMGMKWAAMYCGNAKYVMKTDDDMYVSYPNLVNYLSSHPDTQKGLAMGFLINGSPIRDPKSKWYMPKEIYPEGRYPPFLSGTGYVMSSDVVRRTFIASVDVKFLYLEDVFCATVWHKIGVIPKRHAEFHNWRTAYSFCRYKRIMTTHMVQPGEMRRIWNDQRTRKTKCSW